MDNKIVERNLNGGELYQRLFDSIVAESAHEPTRFTDIIIRNVSTVRHGLPRIVIDYGEIYEAVELLLKERGKIRP